MGCNQTKQEDVQQSRQRVPQQGAQGGGQGRQQTHPIAFGGAQQQTGDYKLGTSATDRRAGEQDFLNNIVERTAMKFIDVSQTAVPLEGNDALERAKEYNAQIMSTKLDSEGAVMLKLPMPSPAVTSTEGLQKALASDGHTSLRSFMDQHLESVSKNYRNMKVVDVGDLVVTLPEVGY